MTVEVFKTNVNDQNDAAWLLECIHLQFPEYKANFALDDCDKILRVQSNTGFIHTPALIGIVSGLGYHAEILSDDDAGDPFPWPYAALEIL